MFAANRRRTADRLLSGVIRATSAVVFLVLGGMFVQMVIVAWPLLQEFRVAEDAPRRSLHDLAAGESGPHASRGQALGGGLVQAGPINPVQQNINVGILDLTNEAAAGFPGAASCAKPDLPQPTLSLKLPGGLGCLTAFSSGEYRILAAEGPAEDPSNPVRLLPTHHDVRTVPGGRSWLLIGDTSVHWVHLRFTNEGPVLEELKIMPVHAGTVDVSQVTKERWVLITDADGAVWLWPLLTGSPYRLDLGVAGVTSATWIGARNLRVVLAGGHERILELVGWPPGTLVTRLFKPIQYEGYPQPKHVWQPSASSADEVAKYNLVPLLSGTLEAALIAVLLSLPVAIGSAIYVGFFLSSRRREQIKPAIEVIASFPTVVLGGLAAVWLAPLVVNDLPQIVGAGMLLPIAALAAVGVPNTTRRAGDRWSRPFLLCFVLVPAVMACIWTGVQLGNLAEHVWFSGSLPDWFAQRNIPVSQFNAVIVGMVLGIAVLPVIFSLTEDAINECPKAAALGSQALGASKWQSFRDVVLPVALPAIISAVMLGLGRAVGETMVFLMLSGNAPDLNLNPMDAVRNLGATLAIELPEAAVGGLHFRILFLAALILFAATFLLNTVAQVIRQRQRSKHTDQIG